MLIPRLAVLLLLLFAQTASALTLFIPNTTASVGEEAKVAINVKDATNVGSIDIVVLYDPSILKVSKVEKGALVKGMLSSNTENEGIVVIGIADSSGISGNGEVARIVFNVVNTGSSLLSLQKAKAYDVNTHAEIEVIAENGVFTAEKSGAKTEQKTPGFELILAVLALAVAVWLRR